MKFIQPNLVALAIAVPLLFIPPPYVGAAPSAELPPLLTGEETKEVNAVLAAMLAAGFPDGQHAHVYVGTIQVFAAFDPNGASRPLPARSAVTRMLVPDTRKVTHGYLFEGLHFKLADGSWIIALAYHFKPAPGDSVKTDGAHEVNLATVTADAMAAHPFDAAKDASIYLEKVPPLERPRLTAALTRIVPVTIQLQIAPEGAMPAAVLLYRAGWAGAAELSLTISQNRARSYWELQLWSDPDWVFDPTGQYLPMRKAATAWAQTQAQFPAEPPAVGMRRAMFRWCRSQLAAPSPEDALLPADVAAAAMKACVDPKDPQHNLSRIDALLAGQKLPATVAPDAPLIARLQSWEEESAPGAAGAEAPAIASFTPQKSDLDALVALLADERPSRFCDFTGPRTLGDNAWRAVAALLKSDPRTLAGYPTDHPWTPAERRAAGKAVQAWWKNHRVEFVEGKKE